MAASPPRAARPGPPASRSPRQVAAVLAAQQAVLGPHPAKLLEQAPDDLLRMAFAPNGILYSIDPPGKPHGAYELVPITTPLAEQVEQFE